MQEALFEALFAAGALRHKPPPRYEFRVLKELLSRIEASIDDWEQHVSAPPTRGSLVRRVNSRGYMVLIVGAHRQGISDNLMSSLSEILSAPMPEELSAVQQRSYVTYHVSLLEGLIPRSDCNISILESRSLVSAAGTTGMRTWEASLHLGQFLCSRPFLVSGKRILELGAGTGYLSILCAKFLSATQVIASDGSDDVVNNLPDNLYINDLQDSGRVISPMGLKWGHALLGTEEKGWNGGREIDLVLGADVTYDKSIIPFLVATLEELVDLFPAVAILIAATQRNLSTFETFFSTCQRHGFHAKLEDFPVIPRDKQTGPFYSDQTPIHICSLSRLPKKPGHGLIDKAVSAVTVEVFPEHNHREPAGH